MSLKENINAIKEELSAEEKFLESMIKGENFFKRNKKAIIITAVAILVGIFGSAIYNYQQVKKLKDSNTLYTKLISKSISDTNLENELKSKNPKLYSLYKFQTIIKTSDLSKLNSLKESIKDPILKDLLTYQIDSISQKNLLAYVGNDGMLKDFASLQQAYIELKNKNFQKASDALSFIQTTSPLKQLKDGFKHYQKEEK